MLRKGLTVISPEEYSIPKKEVFIEFWRNARPHKLLLSLFVLFMLLRGGINGGTIWLLKTAIDYFFKRNDLNGVLFLIGTLFAAVFLKSIMNFLFSWNTLLLKTRIRDKLVIRSFQDLIYNPFHIHMKVRDRKKYGWVLKDSAKFISSFFGMFNSWVDQPFILICTISALMVISPFITCIGMLFMPLAFPVILFLKKKSKEFIAARKKLLGLQEEIVANTIRGIRIVKIFGLEESAINKLKQTIDKQRTISQRNAFHVGLMSPISELLGVIGLSVIIFVANKTVSDTFTTGTFFVFIMAFLGVYGPIKDISKGLANYHLMLDCGSRLLYLRRNAQKKLTRSHTVQISHFQELIVDKMWFSYKAKQEDNNEYVIRDLSLTIRHGETVAIVGETGVGKSTLCDIIFGLYRPSRGAMYLNGVPYEKIDPASLKKNFAICSQETIVFNNSLLEEIRIARPEATPQEVLKAARTAGLGPYISSQVTGLDTWIGDRGTHCSGGQRQMIALARALLQKPELLVLDEALSGVDMETGRIIWKNIRETFPDCTILVVSHHWHIIKHCNRVVTLSEGRIVKDTSVKAIKDPEAFFCEFDLHKSWHPPIKLSVGT